MKFLIIRFSSIGDIVLTTPVVRCLRKAYPDAQIHFLTKREHHPVLAANPYIDKFYLLEHRLSTLLPQLEDEGYDAVIDLHKNLRSMRIRQNLKTQVYSFNKINLEKWLKVRLKVDLLPNKHLVDRYFEALEPLGVVNDGAGLDYFLWEREIERPDNPLLRTPYIAFAIAGTYNTKKLPPEKILQICEGVKDRVVLLGGKLEASTGDWLNERLPEKVVNFCGKLTLNESALMVRHARKVISHDTGLMHIAAAFGKPILSVWGNTIPGFGMYPYFGKRQQEAQQKSHLFEVEGLPCRPCSKLGYPKCPRGHFLCMNDQNIERLIALANEE